MSTMQDVFGEVISSYTRKQALDDGQQVKAPESMCAEAGFKWPVFITREVWDNFVEVPEGVEAQDISGRMWDILWMARLAARKPGPEGPRQFTVYVRNNNRKPQPRTLYMDCGPMDIDDPAPAITIMAAGDL